MLCCRGLRWLATSGSRIPNLSRQYAISLQPTRQLPGRSEPRTFKDKKAFQYNWYTSILNETDGSPLLFLNHTDFTAQRLVKLRRDIAAAVNRVPAPSLTSPTPAPVTPPKPHLTVIRTGIFGAALRDYPNINKAEAEKIFEGTSGSFAVLSLRSFNPPLLDAILRAMDKSVPPRPAKTEEEIKRVQAMKNADPENPGRRMKRQRAVLTPDLKIVGAFIEGKVFLPEGVRDVSKLPTLDTLRAQIVGLLSQPAMQLASVLNEAGGAKLARTLEGLKKSMEEKAG
ncbi:hypothetical protein APHAL10511_002975 [Amanita phalloides]|nr:hypothetical protein APHAL10511_002975 [Amanita phalloides]